MIVSGKQITTKGIGFTHSLSLCLLTPTKRPLSLLFAFFFNVKIIIIIRKFPVFLEYLRNFEYLL